MSEGRKDVVLAAVLAAALGLGAAVDAATGAPEAADPSSERVDPIVARSSFCPPSDAAAGRTRVVLSGPAGATAGVEPVLDEPVEAGGINVVSPEGSDAFDVVGYGTTVTAGAMLFSAEPVRGAGAARCAPAASRTWHFAYGSSSLDADERLLLYNPFPDEAVVRVSFLTATGERAPAALSDIAVPADSSVPVVVNETVQTTKLLGATVEAIRGRIVAWRQQFDDATDAGPAGAELTLGAPAGATTWYLPEGAVGDGVDERVAVMNPSEDEAVVTLALATADDAVTPGGLAQVPVPARSSVAFSLADSLQRVEDGRVGVAVTVRSTNGVGVVVERVVRYREGDVVGVAAETGSTVAATRWVALPAVGEASVDRLVVFNPGRARATLDVALSVLGGGGAGRVPKVTVPGGARVVVPIVEDAEGPAVARVTSDHPVVVERTGYSPSARDVATTMATPETD